MSPSQSNRPRVTIHLQGGNHLGMGHLLRMSWLARSLRRHGLVVEMLLRGDRGAEAFLRKSGFPVFTYPVHASAHTAVDRYLTRSRWRPAAWINDCLTVARSVNTAVHHYRIPIMSFDEMGDNLRPGDAVISAMPSFWRDDQSLQARLYQGQAYMVLDPMVRRFHDHPKVIRQRPTHLAVTFGGSDPHGLIFKVFEVVRLVHLPMTWHMFIGPLFPHLTRLPVWKRRLAGQATIQWHHAKEDVIPWFTQADIALCSGGHTLFEMLGIGTPALVIANAPHEEINGRYFASQGACRFLGRHHQVQAKSIARTLTEVFHDASQRASLSDRGKSLIDGRGTERATQIILEIVRRSTGASGSTENGRSRCG